MSNLSGEDLGIENVDRAERLLVEKYGELSKSLSSWLSKMRQILVEHEIDDRLLGRIADVMYEVPLMDNIDDVEVAVKYLNDTFWYQDY